MTLPACNERLDQPVPEPERGTIGLRREKYLNVVDHSDGIARQDRSNIAQAEQHAVAPTEWQRDLLPWDAREG